MLVRVRYWYYPDHDSERLLQDHGDTKWYRAMIRFLLNPISLEGKPLNQRRLVRQRAVHYRVHRGQFRYVKRDGALSYHVLPQEVQAALDWAHDRHGHFALDITPRNIRGQRYPLPVKQIADGDCYYRYTDTSYTDSLIFLL